MKFKIEGSWYYAPVIFEEEDITVALRTAINVEGELSIWNEKEKMWDWLYIASAEYETNLNLLESHGVDEEKRKMCASKNVRSDVLVVKTDDYFYMGGGVIDFSQNLVTGRAVWIHDCRSNCGDELEACEISRYNICCQGGEMIPVYIERKWN